MPNGRPRPKFARAAKPSAKMTKLLRDSMAPFDGLLPIDPAVDVSPANLPFLAPEAPMGDLLDDPLDRPKKRPNKKPNTPSEADFQITLIVFLRRVLPKDAIVFHIPNSGHTDWVRMHNKRLGVLSGLPDLCIVWRGKAYWMELKRPKMKATDQQRDVHDMLVDCGCLRPAVVHTIEEAMNALEWWGIPTIGKLSRGRI